MQDLDSPTNLRAFKTPQAVRRGRARSVASSKYVGLGLATLIFLILLSRQLRKRENEKLIGEPVWLREIQSPATLAQLEADTLAYQPTAPRVELYQGDNPAGRERQIVESADSERIAQQVRSWIKT